MEPSANPIGKTKIKASSKTVVVVLVIAILLGGIGMIAWLMGWSQAVPEGTDEAPPAAQTTDR